MTTEMLDDDRLDRWYAANGITAMGYRTLTDGCVYRPSGNYGAL
jgi:hypothetical protein